MTKIRIECISGVWSVDAAGHAAYDSSGRDIVCAAISALIFSMSAEVEEMERLGLINPGARAELSPGRAHIAFRPRLRGRRRAEGALGVLRRGFEMLAEEYPENVEFKEYEGKN